MHNCFLQSAQTHIEPYKREKNVSDDLIVEKFFQHC